MAPKQQTKVAVLGLGYIGLPTAAVVARSGAQVLGIDIHEHVVETVNSGGGDIHEEDPSKWWKNFVSPHLTVYVMGSNEGLLTPTCI